METGQNQAVAQGKGCSSTVAGMAAVLAFVVGLLGGAGGFFGYVKNSDKAAGNLGLGQGGEEAACPPSEVAEKECPPCDEAAANNTPTYALVYPIEQTLRIEGDLDPALLKEFVIKRRFKMQSCYQSILESDPSVKGEISLQFTASRSGSIVAALSRQDTVKNADLNKCIISEIKTWNFEEGVIKSDVAVVKFDVLFTPIGSSGP